MAGFNPPNIHPPRDGRSSARRYNTASTAPAVAQGKVSGQDLYVQSKMNALTATPGRTHDTDPNGGLHSGSLNDAPVRSGGYTQGQLGGQEAQQLKQQYQDEHANLSADDQKAWQDQADTQNAANHVDGFQISGAFPVSTTPAQNAATAPTSTPTSNASVPAAPQILAGTAADSQQALQDSTQIPDNQSGGYGKIGQVASYSDPSVPGSEAYRTNDQTADGSGNTNIATAGGGEVSIPNANPQTGESSIRINGTAQNKQSNGSYFPGTTPQSSASPSDDDEDDEVGSARAFPGTMPNAFARR